MSGCSLIHAPIVVNWDGSISSTTVSRGPWTASPRNWLQSESDSRSYMTRAPMMSMPDTPKVSVTPSICRA